MNILVYLFDKKLKTLNTMWQDEHQTENTDDIFHTSVPTYVGTCEWYCFSL